MQIITTVNAKLRSAPVFSVPDTANMIKVVDKGTVLTAIDYDASWYQVSPSGYMHKSVASVVVPVPPPTPLLYVPYKSQWESDAHTRINDCGQTCVAMLMAWKGVNVSIDTLTRQSNPSGLSSADDLVRNFADNGFTAQARYVSASDTIPNKSICLVWYGGFDRANVWDKNFKGWHWLVYLEMVRINGRNWMVCHDPDYPPDSTQGAHHLYSPDEWQKAFIPADTQRQIVTLS